MGSKTKIEWTEACWNPVTGCVKVSPGCKHCYAEGIAERFFAKQYPPNADGSARKFTDVRCHPERLGEPLRRRKPTMYFVNSMSDLFHEDVPFEFIAQVWQVCSRAPQHTFQILTKRPKRMLEFSQWMAGRDHVSIAEWPRNVWLGVSVENMKYACDRIGLLTETPAAVRFISAEPLLEEIFIELWLEAQIDPSDDNRLYPGIDWVIVGGESGPGARPFNLSWAESLLRQCKAARVPFFMKQIGSNSFWDSPERRIRLATGSDGFTRTAVRNPKGGDMAEWPEWLRVRELPKGKAVAA